MVFDRQWFCRHQTKLLWFLNTPIIRLWFRWVMGIDCKKYIHRIEPNAISFDAVYDPPQSPLSQGGSITQTTELRTHNKYAKRLYYAFYPIWAVMHAWDMAFAQRNPALNFGFDTLTAYPDAHPESTTVDGYVYYAPGNTIWATIHGAATGSVAFDNVTNGVFCGIVAHGTSNRFNVIHRGFFLFDTSSISGVTISAVVFSLYGKDKTDTFGIGSDIDVVSSSPASNTELVTADYNDVGSTAFGSMSYASYSTSAYNDITLDANGIANITQGGISKFGVRVSNDTDNSAPTWSASKVISFRGYYADQTGTTYDPKLTVTYSSSLPIKINIGDVWKDGAAAKINIGDVWKDVASVQINVGDTWKNVF